jgi:hypothetical protein
VHDPSGAVVSGASITLKSIGTGVSNTTLSNSVGEYTFDNVPIGDYVITAKGSGFKEISTSGFTLTVGERQRVDLALSSATVS